MISTLSFVLYRLCPNFLMGEYCPFAQIFSCSKLYRGCDNFSILVVGTLVYNILDVPAGCLPVTRVNSSLDALTEEWHQGPGHGSPLLEKGIFKAQNALYNPETLEGMPISIQVVCKKWEEEKLLRVMSLIDDILGDRGFGPGAVDKAGSKST